MLQSKQGSLSMDKEWMLIAMNLIWFLLSFAISFERDYWRERAEKDD